MADISTAHGIPIAHLQQLDTSKLKAVHVSEMPEDMFQRFVEVQKSMLEHQYTHHPDTSRNLAYSEYAKIVVNGETVAEIDNHGWVKSSNSTGGKIQGRLMGDVDGQTGPVLAQARAELIAALLGGEIIKSPTALTQAQFLSTPEPERIIDYKAMREDPRYEKLQETIAARTRFLAQQISQSG